MQENFNTYLDSFFHLKRNFLNEQTFKEFKHHVNNFISENFEGFPELTQNSHVDSLCTYLESNTNLNKDDIIDFEKNTRRIFGLA